MTQGIDYFNRGHWLTDIQERVSYSARRRMFELWKVFYPQSARHTMLDIGATPDVERIDSNCFLPWLNEEGVEVTCYSPEEIEGIKSVFPFVKILKGSFQEKHLPVKDQSYDWSMSSAVLEHVGSQEDQIEFIKEQARVANGVFLTTPNRYHWLEFHTKIPLIHWLPRKIHRIFLRLLGLKFWAEEKNLRLVGKRELSRIAQSAFDLSEWTYEIKTIRSLGMKSNLVLLAIRSSHNQK